MAEVNQRRQQILDFIQRFIREKGYAPTMRDIMRGCNIKCIASVQHHLGVLEKESYINRTPEVSRSISLTGRGKRTVKVPVIGYIVAGELIPRAPV